MRRLQVMGFAGSLVLWACATPSPATDDETSEGGGGANAGGSAGKGGAATSGGAGTSGVSGGGAAGVAAGGSPTAGSPGGAGAPTAGSPGTAGAPAGSAGAAGAPTAGSPGAGGSASGSLDPGLSVPASGTPCSTPGSFSGCPSLEVCRISSEMGGTCEGCTDCGNLNAICTTSQDCDILFQCYQGKCRNICPLGTMYCGAPSNCLDVGHATYGVCKN